MSHSVSSTLTHRVQGFRSFSSGEEAWLAVIVKEGHALYGRPRLHEPRAVEVLRDRVRIDERFVEESDLSAAVKPHCDVLVSGAAYNAGGGTSVVTSVEVAGLRRVVRATGERRMTVSGTELAFGAPAPFERMEITSARAYGGRVERPRRRGQFGALARSDEARDESVSYPRNRAGVGFTDLASARRLHGRIAPCLDDPEDPISAERLLLDRVEDWEAAPTAAHYGPIDLGEFPRAQYVRPFRLSRPSEVFEVRKGVLEVDETGSTAAFGDLRGAQSAAPGMYGRVVAGDVMRTQNLFPGGGEVSLRVPRGPRFARLELPGCGGFETELALRTVHLRPDEAQLEVTLVGKLRVSMPFREGALQGVRATVHD